MKKTFLFLLVLVCFGFSAYSQQASGFNAGVKVDYYNHGSKTGHLIVNNTTNASIEKAHITVTVKIVWREGEGYLSQKKTKTLVLCDDDFYNLPQGECQLNASNQGEIKGGPEKEGKSYIYNVEVKVIS